jgi:hypothetical protein
LRLTTTDIAPASCFSGAIVSIITRMRCVEKRIEGTIVDAEADSLDNVNINEPCLLQFLLTLGDDIVTSVDSVIDDSSTSSGAGVRISHRGQTRVQLGSSDMSSVAMTRSHRINPTAPTVEGADESVRGI